MATLDRMIGKHDDYVWDLERRLRQAGFQVDKAGLEDTAPGIDKSGIRLDYSLEALKLRCRPDLQVWYPETRFFFYVDAKTVTFRVDTGNVAIEVWPVLLGRRDKIPRLFAVKYTRDSTEEAESGLWIDRIPPAWLKTVYMPIRWVAASNHQIESDITELTRDTTVCFWNVSWDTHNASGDPYYLWPIKRIERLGRIDVCVEALRRAHEGDTPVLGGDQLALLI